MIVGLYLFAGRERKRCSFREIRRENEWIASMGRVAMESDGNGFWAAQSMGCGRKMTVDEGGRDKFFG